MTPIQKKVLHDVVNALLCGVLIGFITLCIFNDWKIAAAACAAGAVGYYVGWGEANDFDL